MPFGVYYYMAAGFDNLLFRLMVANNKRQRKAHVVLIFQFIPPGLFKNIHNYC
jgi:hypothetical protein